jgi:hypothetical protein
VLSVIFVLTLFGGCSFESKGPKYEIFPPAGGKGAIVVVASGNSGPGLYRDFSSKLAGLGYYTVLMDGKYLFDPGSLGLIVPGMENLQTVIAESKSSPQAIPGKVSLVGFSVGGAGVLSYGTKLKDLPKSPPRFHYQIPAFRLPCRRRLRFMGKNRNIPEPPSSPRGQMKNLRAK